MRDNLREVNLLVASELFASEIHEGDFLCQSSNHDIVILDCGINDLATDISTSTVVNNVFLFAVLKKIDSLQDAILDLNGRNSNDSRRENNRQRLRSRTPVSYRHSHSMSPRPSTSETGVR